MGVQSVAHRAESGRLAPPRNSPTASARAHPLDRLAELSRGVLSEGDAWSRYASTRDEACRDYLIAKYHRVLRAIAAKSARRLPAMVDAEDLISVGLFGLLRAMETFEPARGIKFQTYCGKHIFGAINDWLREIDWAPRAVRRSETIVRRVSEEFAMRHGRGPTRDELVAEVRRHRPDDRRDASLVVRDAQTVGLTSLSQERGVQGDGFRTIDMVVNESASNASDPLRQRMLRDLVTKGLDRERQLVLILYYYENLTMREIGQVLDKSESRVSQMHAEVLDWLRTRLRERRGELTPL